MNIVKESIGDILKPKPIEDIRQVYKNLIFWKGIIDGKLSPDSLKYFLDKKFIKEKAKEYGMDSPKTQWQKQLIHILDIIENKPELHLSEDRMRDISSLRFRFDINKEGAALYTGITNIFDREYKDVNRVFAQKVGKDLREEKIGNYGFNDRVGNFHYTEMYINPLVIKRMEPNIRAVSDKEGNLFVFDMANILHGRMLNYLHDNEIMMDAGWDDDNGFYDNMITWHRLKDTNKFYLGESYSENIDVLYLPRVQRWINKVKEKNPQFEFVEELIYDVKDDPSLY